MEIHLCDISINLALTSGAGRDVFITRPVYHCLSVFISAFESTLLKVRKTREINKSDQKTIFSCLSLYSTSMLYLEDKRGHVLHVSIIKRAFIKE